MNLQYMRDTIKNTTSAPSNDYNGVDIIDNNGNYKPTIDVLDSIASVYHEIKDLDEQNGTNNAEILVEELCGKELKTK